MRLSVIVPVLNERQTLPILMEALGEDSRREIILVDGGSTDGTIEWVLGQDRMSLVRAEAGRGQQLHAGALAANGEVLLFLHADCLPGLDFQDRIEQSLADSHAIGGAFSVEFGCRRTAGLSVTAWLINLHSRLFGWATGDQGLFVRAGTYRDSGGFKDWPLFEDVELVGRLKKYGQFKIVDAPVTISSRRWRINGILRTNLLMCRLYLAYRMGVPAQQLKKMYGDVRDTPEPDTKDSRCCSATRP